MTTFHIVTIFPETFSSYLNEGVLGRAINKKKIVKIKFYNPRDYTKDKHKRARPDGRPFGRVDSIPYGGGPGMVMLVSPILKAWQKAKGQKKDVKTIILSPGGKEFTNRYAKKLSEEFNHIILIAGRYEGIDARVKKITKAEEISIGNYVLTGGELPAMVMIDTISRQIEGVLGDYNSLEENRISSGEVYTKPREIRYKGKSYKVPEVLTSGHHAKIDKWKTRKKL